MNKEWSEKNKEFQKLISKEATFKDGIKILLELRASVFEQITQIVNGYPKKAFNEMPFAGADGYHSKTLAYSIWHIFRIEDIVCHTLILKDKQILDSGNWQKKIGADRITTGNELAGQQIADFSKKPDVKSLYEYAKAVMESTNDFLNSVEYSALKNVFNEEDRQRVIDCGGVSSDENAFWLVDYWCKKKCGRTFKNAIQPALDYARGSNAADKGQALQKCKKRSRPDCLLRIFMQPLFLEPMVRFLQDGIQHLFFCNLFTRGNLSKYKVLQRKRL
ncbi:MAG: hypothetical protein MJ184_11675 [Treponema sp.]|uniref:hypothetical protein n=1 Tax=Treponema sp. TaxID=166 RepID=UPI00298EB0E9|nr:hypothetical protein [Treponema sp.]MCQ2602008.1 hypothetical protein [Treponema sp.]